VYEARHLSDADKMMTTYTAMDTDDPPIAQTSSSSSSNFAPALRFRGSLSLAADDGRDCSEALESIVGVLCDTNKMAAALSSSLQASSSSTLTHGPAAPAPAHSKAAKTPSSSRRDLNILNSLAFARHTDGAISQLWAFLSRCGEDLLLDLLLLHDGSLVRHTHNAFESPPPPTYALQQSLASSPQQLQPQPSLRVLEESARLGLSPTRLSAGAYAALQLFFRLFLHRLSATDGN